MKKVIAVLCAAVMTLGTAAAVFAAPSVEVTGVVNRVVSATDANGNPIEVTIKDLPEEYKALAEEIKNVEKLKELLGDLFAEGMQVVDVKDVTVPEGTAFPATLTFEIPGVKADSQVAVLHYDTEKKEWEVVTCKAGNGTIEATFNSLSPVAFVVGPAKGSTPDAKQTGAGGTKSPKTGETPIAAYAGIIAAAAVLGMGVTYYKKKKVS